MLGFLVDWILKLINYLQSFTGNLGYTLILFAFVLRFLVFPFYLSQVRYMKKMKELQPEIDKIRVVSKNPREDEAKLYRARGINPLALITSTLLQAFTFISVFSALRNEAFLASIQSGELFFGWNLLEKDPTYIFPALNTIFITLVSLQSSPSNGIMPFALAGFMFFISMKWKMAMLICMTSLSAFNLMQFLIIKQFRLDE